MPRSLGRRGDSHMAVSGQSRDSAFLGGSTTVLRVPERHEIRAVLA